MLAIAAFQDKVVLLTLGGQSLVQKQQWRLWHCTTVVGMEVEILFHSSTRLKEVISNRDSSPSCINFQSRSSGSLSQSFTLAQL